MTWTLDRDMDRDMDLANLSDFVFYNIICQRISNVLYSYPSIPIVKY